MPNSSHATSLSTSVADKSAVRHGTAAAHSQLSSGPGQGGAVLGVPIPLSSVLPSPHGAVGLYQQPNSDSSVSRGLAFNTPGLTSGQLGSGPRTTLAQYQRAAVGSSRSHLHPGNTGALSGALTLGLAPADPHITHIRPASALTSLLDASTSPPRPCTLTMHINAPVAPRRCSDVGDQDSPGRQLSPGTISPRATHPLSVSSKLPQHHHSANGSIPIAIPLQMQRQGSRASSAGGSPLHASRLANPNLAVFAFPRNGQDTGRGTPLTFGGPAARGPLVTPQQPQQQQSPPAVAQHPYNHSGAMSAGNANGENASVASSDSQAIIYSFGTTTATATATPGTLATARASFSGGHDKPVLPAPGVGPGGAVILARALSSGGAASPEPSEHPGARPSRGRHWLWSCFCMQPTQTDGMDGYQGQDDLTAGTTKQKAALRRKTSSKRLSHALSDTGMVRSVRTSLVVGPSALSNGSSAGTSTPGPTETSGGASGAAVLAKHSSRKLQPTLSSQPQKSILKAPSLRRAASEQDPVLVTVVSSRFGRGGTTGAVVNSREAQTTCSVSSNLQLPEEGTESNCPCEVLEPARPGPGAGASLAVRAVRPAAAAAAGGLEAAGDLTTSSRIRAPWDATDVEPHADGVPLLADVSGAGGEAPDRLLYGAVGAAGRPRVSLPGDTTFADPHTGVSSAGHLTPLAGGLSSRSLSPSVAAIQAKPAGPSAAGWFTAAAEPPRSGSEVISSPFSPGAALSTLPGSRQHPHLQVQLHGADGSGFGRGGLPSGASARAAGGRPSTPGSLTATAGEGSKKSLIHRVTRQLSRGTIIGSSVNSPVGGNSGGGGLAAALTGGAPQARSSFRNAVLPLPPAGGSTASAGGGGDGGGGGASLRAEDSLDSLPGMSPAPLRSQRSLPRHPAALSSSDAVEGLWPPGHAASRDVGPDAVQDLMPTMTMTMTTMAAVTATAEPPPLSSPSPPPLSLPLLLPAVPLLQHPRGGLWLQPLSLQRQSTRVSVPGRLGVTDRQSGDLEKDGLADCRSDQRSAPLSGQQPLRAVMMHVLAPSGGSGGVDGGGGGGGEGAASGPVGLQAVSTGNNSAQRLGMSDAYSAPGMRGPSEQTDWVSSSWSKRQLRQQQRPDAATSGGGLPYAPDTAIPQLRQQQRQRRFPEDERSQGEEGGGGRCDLQLNFPPSPLRGLVRGPAAAAAGGSAGAMAGARGAPVSLEASLHLSNLDLEVIDGQEGRPYSPVLTPVHALPMGLAASEPAGAAGAASSSGATRRAPSNPQALPSHSVSASSRGRANGAEAAATAVVVVPAVLNSPQSPGPTLDAGWPAPGRVRFPAQPDESPRRGRRSIEMLAAMYGTTGSGVDERYARIETPMNDDAASSIEDFVTSIGASLTATGALASAAQSAVEDDEQLEVEEGTDEARAKDGAAAGQDEGTAAQTGKCRAASFGSAASGNVDGGHRQESDQARRMVEAELLRMRTMGIAPGNNDEARQAESGIAARATLPAEASAYQPPQPSQEQQRTASKGLVMPAHRRSEPAIHGRTYSSSSSERGGGTGGAERRAVAAAVQPRTEHHPPHAQMQPLGPQQRHRLSVTAKPDLQGSNGTDAMAALPDSQEARARLTKFYSLGGSAGQVVGPGQGPGVGAPGPARPSPTMGLPLTAAMLRASNEALLLRSDSKVAGAAATSAAGGATTVAGAGGMVPTVGASCRPTPANALLGGAQRDSLEVWVRYHSRQGAADRGVPLAPLDPLDELAAVASFGAAGAAGAGSKTPFAGPGGAAVAAAVAAAASGTAATSTAKSQRPSGEPAPVALPFFRMGSNRGARLSPEPEVLQQWLHRNGSVGVGEVLSDGGPQGKGGSTAGGGDGGGGGSGSVAATVAAALSPDGPVLRHSFPETCGSRASKL